MKYLLIILLFISPVVWGNELKDFRFQDHTDLWIQKIKQENSEYNCTSTKPIMSLSFSSNLVFEKDCTTSYFHSQTREFSIAYEYKVVDTDDFGMVMNYQSFTFGLTFDTKTYQNGSESFVIRKPKINASYKGMFHIGKHLIHHKITARWINPKKLMKFDDKIFPSRPLMDSRSEISSRVIYIGWHWKY